MVAKRNWIFDQKLSDVIGQAEKDNILDDKTGITFQTCNYNTFIFPTQYCYLIDTCHNYDFYDLFDDIDYNLEDDIVKEMNEKCKVLYEYKINSLNGVRDLLDMNILPFMGRYWAADCEVFGSFPYKKDRLGLLSSYSVCPKDYYHETFVLDNGDKYCLDCYRSEKYWAE